MKIQTIKEGNVVLPKDYKKLTVAEFYFISDYFNKINAEFTKAIKPKKSYKNKMKRLVKKAKRNSKTFRP